jgi:23S rRNA (adenine2030-N6)-methyltransferase
MGSYDHRTHAGNAGDVWKHLLLAEATDFILAPGASLVYAESHVGSPCYLLKSPGEWEGGIGRLLPILPTLYAFPYFRILSDLNRTPNSGSLIYPGSARLVHELAIMRGAELRAEVWDNSPDVAESWKSYLCEEANASEHPAEFSFHLADGFSGLLSLLEGSSSCSSPGLMLIDPPYLDPEDLRLAEELLLAARDSGGTVLWWHIMDMKTAPEGLRSFDLKFSEVGLEGGRWSGAVISVAGEEGERLFRLLDHLRARADLFIRMLKSDRT